MKATLKFISLFLIVLSFNACDEVDELTEFEVTDSVSESENVNIPEDIGMPIEFSIQENFDISSITEINNDREFIESVSINSIDYTFSNFSGNPEAIITEAELSSGSIIVPLEDINLKSSADNNILYQITDPAKLAQFSNLLNNETTEITMGFKGILDGTPATFDVEISINLTIVIDVI